jgi:hypothetical protein
VAGVLRSTPLPILCHSDVVRTRFMVDSVAPAAG